MSLSDFLDADEIGFDKPIFGVSKTCIDCGLTLPLNCFHSKRSNLDRVECRCKVCKKKRTDEMKQIRRTAPPRPSICECCDKEIKHDVTRRKMSICMDHDPDTKKFRGWICNECNLGIGMFGDRLSNIEKVYKYMKSRSSNV